MLPWCVSVVRRGHTRPSDWMRTPEVRLVDGVQLEDGHYKPHWGEDVEFRTAEGSTAPLPSPPSPFV